MRSELLQRIQDLLGNEDLEAIRKDVRSAIQSFHALTQDEVRRQRDAWEKEEHEPDETFIYKPSEEEAIVEELSSSFKEREKAWKASIAKEQRANLVTKEGLLERLRSTIQEEENIGKAFSSFNEVRAEWEAVGDVPGNNYKDIHDEYHRLRDEFFYNINIYKQLQDHDLKKNHATKLELTEKAKNLAAVEDLKEREKMARELQKQWLDVGPSPRETYKEMADTFFGITRPVFDEVKAQYDKLRESFVEHKISKEALIEELRGLMTEDIEESHKVWKTMTINVIDMQKRWKEIGFSGKEHNESLWHQFRELSDVFFEKKQVFYDKMKEEGKDAKKEKIVLCEKAESIQDSNDWKDTTAVMIQLQKDWKIAGSCPPGEEHKLWRRFHKAQDFFFKAKKAQFADRNKEEKVNLGLKNALLEKVEAFKITDNRIDDLNVLKEFSGEWRKIGFVPRKKFENLSDRFTKAMDKHYDALSAQRSERSVASYQNRVERLSKGGKSGRGGGNDIRREQAVLRDKINRLNTRVVQTEENMERFTGKGAQSIRDHAEKSIKSYKREVEEIKAKLKMLREAEEK
ncbi:MAG: DUF349 domain-containing protein [Flavobacteriales bacterium]|jgi:hypothetical protein|nr:DUF349 domain-containing protein [Flavobacteriales bacterium]MBT6175280.1 DUF349 domain-containing protein [Flavobacteriales bacterium]